VFLHNTAPGVVERLGLDADTLRAANPRLVVVTISGYGTSGPRRDRKAYDMLVQAESGMVSVTGTPDTPTKTGIPSADIGAGLYAAVSALSALFRRERTGEGAVIDVSMFDAAVEWMGHPLYMRLYGQILIGVQNDRGWRTLVTEVFGHPEHANDPRFATNVDRVTNRAECDRLEASFTTRWETAALDERLAEAGIPAAQLNDTADLTTHPQLSERDRWRTVSTETGDIRAVLPPMTFRDVELPMGPIPALGEHTAAILAELGLKESSDV
jgi:formyl-CoA transferase